MAVVTLIAPFARYSGSVGKPTTENAIGGQVLMPDAYGRTLARAYVVPNQPDSATQILAQGRVSAIAEAMQSLTLPQVEAWAAAAATIEKTGRLQLTRKLTWTQLFHQVNNFRLQDGQSITSTVPSIASVPSITGVTAITSEFNEPDYDLTITLTSSTSTTSGFLAIRLSRPLGSPVRQARDTDFRYVNTPANSILARQTGTSADYALTATLLNIAEDDNVGLEVKVLNPEYVPVSRFVARNVLVTSPS